MDPPEHASEQTSATAASGCPRPRAPPCGWGVRAAALGGARLASSRRRPPGSRRSPRGPRPSRSAAEAALRVWRARRDADHATGRSWTSRCTGFCA